MAFIAAFDDPDARGQAAEAFGCAGFFRKTDSGEDLLAAIRAPPDWNPYEDE